MKLMWDRLRDIADLLRTPVGRNRLHGLLLHYAWPLTSRLARIYRRTVLRRTRIIVVVGSYGKTTTSRSVTAALGERVRRTFTGNHKGPVASAILHMLPFDRTAVLEIGINNKGQMGPFAKTVQPDVAVVTSIGSEHHRSLGTIETTRNEKAGMVRILSPSGFAVLNGDDPNVRWMAGQTRAKIVTYGFGDANQIRASEIQLDWPHGTRFLLHANGATRQLRVRLIGRYMLYPILAAAAVALVEGCSLDECVPRLEKLGPTPGRMEVRLLDNGAVLLCDYYKSSYDTIVAALDVFSEIPAKRRIVVFGEITEPPGSQGPLYRGLGARIAQMASRAVFLGHRFQPYKAGATRAGLPAEALVNAGKSVLEAAEAVKGDLGPGDVVLIKGRGEQRLDRVACVLAGRNVRCDIPICKLKTHTCSLCPMLEREWSGVGVTK